MNHDIHREPCMAASTCTFPRCLTCGPAWGTDCGGLCSLTGGLQRTCGQGQTLGSDWEEQSPWSEPKWWLVSWTSVLIMGWTFQLWSLCYPGGLQQLKGTNRPGGKQPVKQLHWQAPGVHEVRQEMLMALAVEGIGWPLIHLSERDSE